jgi:hypothetical protein
VSPTAYRAQKHSAPEKSRRRRPRPARYSSSLEAQRARQRAQRLRVHRQRPIRQRAQSPHSSPVIAAARARGRSPFRLHTHARTPGQWATAYPMTSRPSSQPRHAPVRSRRCVGVQAVSQTATQRPGECGCSRTRAHLQPLRTAAEPPTRVPRYRTCALTSPSSTHTETVRVTRRQSVCRRPAFMVYDRHTAAQRTQLLTRQAPHGAASIRGLPGGCSCTPHTTS